MDTKLLLIKVISLLHIESELKTFGSDAVLLTRQVLDKTEIPNQGAEQDYTRETVEGLMSTANWALGLISNQTPLVKEELLQRILINVKGEVFVYNAYVEFTKSLGDNAKLEIIRRNTVDEVNHYYNAIEIEKILKRYRSELIFNKAKINWAEFVSKIILELEPYQRLGGNGVLEALGVISRINVGDVESVVDHYKPAEGETSAAVTRTFQWGWQGINKFWGSIGGIRGIDFFLVSALSHNFKSTFLTNTFRQFAVYNHPYPTMKPGLIPTGLFITYEETSDDIYAGIYAQIILNQTGEAVNSQMVAANIVEVSAVVRDYLKQNGWNIEIVHVNPDDTGYAELFSLYEYYEALGNEIQFCVIDSLHKLSNAGTTDGPFGTNIKNKYSRVRNFFAAKGCALVSAHQMNGEALKLVKNGFGDNLVKEVKGKGLYDGVSTLQQEPGGEIYLHKIEGDDGDYLTIGRGKWRVKEIVPTKDQYCVYRFSDNKSPAGFPDDINGPSMALAKIGGDVGFAFSDDL